MKTIFDKDTRFIFGGRDFEVVFWGEKDEDGEYKRITYKNVKTAKIYTGEELKEEGFVDLEADVKYLQLVLDDGRIATFENEKVSLFHI